MGDETTDGGQHGASSGQCVLRFEVGSEQLGRRLDHVLVGLISGFSRSRLQALVKDGAVTVGGTVVRKSNFLFEAPAVLELALPEARPAALDVSGAPIRRLRVLHVDADVIVIDKPAGLASHPKLSAGPSAPLGGDLVPLAPAGGLSVSDLATAEFGALPCGQGLGRPGIVHRLDRLTSGVMILARTEAAMEALMRQFRHRTVEKTYLALVHGEPRFDSLWVDVPLAANPKSPDRQRVATPAQVDSGEARDAETFVEVRERFGVCTLLACRPKTGRTHQIRVHLQHTGLPIVGDRIYHPRGGLALPLPPDAPVPQRQCLHASALAFDHPTTGERICCEAPLPADFQSLLQYLRAPNEPTDRPLGSSER
jgi:23S rRNA pseudouridine1911/1915/1917 synthase